MSLSPTTEDEVSSQEHEGELHQAVKGFLFNNEYAGFQEIYSAVNDYGDRCEVGNLLNSSEDFSSEMFRHEDTGEPDMVYYLEDSE